jgi:hypothetical protein
MSYAAHRHPSVIPRSLVSHYSVWLQIRKCLVWILVSWLADLRLFMALLSPSKQLSWQGKGKFVISQALCHEDIWRSGGIAPSFLTSALDECDWSPPHPCHFTPGERAPGIHCIGGWVSPRFGLDCLDIVEKRNILHCQKMNPCCPDRRNASYVNITALNEDRHLKQYLPHLKHILWNFSPPATLSSAAYTDLPHLGHLGFSTGLKGILLGGDYFLDL